MPTRHYTMSATVPEALNALRRTAEQKGWQVDDAASGPVLLVLKRGETEDSYGWSVNIQITGDEDGVVSLVAGTTDMNHAGEMHRSRVDLDELFAAAGASHS